MSFITKRRLASLASASALVATMAVAAAPGATLAAADCQLTGFYRDGMYLTAAQIGGPVTGGLDATGCDIGVYNPDSVTNADIHGARYFGVVANGGTLDVTNSVVHNIGNVPFDGTQHGVGIYFTNASGTISGNTVDRYQKGGIVTRDGGKVTISGNTVTGLGKVGFIAQNGIQVSFGTTARLFGNDVSGNWYTPNKVTATGLLIYKADGVSGNSKSGGIKADNNFHDNEADVFTNSKGGTTADFSL
jgi:parallel beta-helix repeat protein